MYTVNTVEWDEYGGNDPLTACPNNGGKRIFPDATSPDDVDVAYRKRVAIRATFTPAVSGLDVLFRNWDVDDPSSNSSPVDPNGSSGDDNRGSPHTGSWITESATTDANGQAIEFLDVTMRPGDNFRVAASCSQSALSSMTQAQADSNSPPSNVKLSEMLTVWRKLRIDSDRMQADTGNTNWLSGTIDAATFDDPYTDLEVNDVPADFEEDDHFNEGFIKVAYAPPQTLDVADFVSSINDDDAYVLGNHTAANNKDYELYDDDYGSNLNLLSTFPGDSDTSELEQAFKPAYVLPVVDTNTQDSNIAFDRNVEDAEIVGLITTDFAYSACISETFWGAHLICAFQGRRNYDADPDSEPEVYAGMSEEAYHGCLIFREATRDAGAPEANIVIHELGHITGPDHEDGGVMADPKNSSSFTATSLGKIRDEPWP